MMALDDSFFAPQSFSVEQEFNKSISTPWDSKILLEKIYHLLKKAGDEGCLNYELAKVTFRFATRIEKLRKLGFNILTLHETGNTFRYILKGHQPSNKPKKVITSFAIEKYLRNSLEDIECYTKKDINELLHWAIAMKKLQIDYNSFEVVK